MNSFTQSLTVIQLIVTLSRSVLMCWSNLKALTELFPPGPDNCTKEKWLLSTKHGETEKEKSICIQQVARNTTANES